MMNVRRPKIASAVCALALMFWSHSVVRAQDGERAALVAELMELTHQKKAAMDFVSEGLPPLLAKFRQTNPGIPDNVWKVFVETMLAEFQQETPLFVDAVGKYWGDGFSASELSDLIAFYKTPTGQKLAAKRGEMNVATREAARAWGASVGQRAGDKAQQKIKAMGYDLKL